MVDEGGHEAGRVKERVGAHGLPEAERVEPRAQLLAIPHEHISRQAEHLQVRQPTHRCEVGRDTLTVKVVLVKVLIRGRGRGLGRGRGRGRGKG